MSFDPPTWLEAQRDAIEDAINDQDWDEAARLSHQTRQYLRRQPPDTPALKWWTRKDNDQ